MSDFLSERVLLFAGEALAASTLAMALAFFAAFARRASLRHLVWAASFAALVALPLLAAVVPGAVVLAVPAEIVAPVPPPDTIPAAPLPESSLERAPAPALAPAPQGFPLDSADAATVLIAIWIAGAMLIALRHLLAAFLLWRLRRDSVEHPFEASELPEGGRPCALRLSRGAAGPLTWGVLRPVVLLPNKAQFWPNERLQAVLRHEFAHVRRRDGLSQMLARIACALYWPNPFVWLGARALRREAEIAADDAVIASGVTPSDYAGELLRLAKEFRAQGLSPALSMAAPSALPARVKAILAPTQEILRVRDPHPFSASHNGKETL